MSCACCIKSTENLSFRIFKCVFTVWQLVDIVTPYEMVPPRAFQVMSYFESMFVCLLQICVFINTSLQEVLPAWECWNMIIDFCLMCSQYYSFRSALPLCVGFLAQPLTLHLPIVWLRTVAVQSTCTCSASRLCRHACGCSNSAVKLWCADLCLWWAGRLTGCYLQYSIVKQTCRIAFIVCCDKRTCLLQLAYVCDACVCFSTLSGFWICHPMPL